MYEYTYSYNPNTRGKISTLSQHALRNPKPYYEYQNVINNFRNAQFQAELKKPEHKDKKAAKNVGYFSFFFPLTIHAFTSLYTCPLYIHSLCTHHIHWPTLHSLTLHSPYTLVHSAFTHSLLTYYTRNEQTNREGFGFYSLTSRFQTLNPIHRRRSDKLPKMSFTNAVVMVATSDASLHRNCASISNSNNTRIDFMFVSEYVLYILFS
jgi:hypothetical protein